MVNGFARKHSRSLPWSGAGKGWPLMNTNRPISSGRDATAWRHSQIPSRRSICTSVTTASNGCRSTASNPSTPSSAVTTSHPRCSRPRRSVVRTRSSSSTTRIRSLVASVIGGSPGGAGRGVKDARTARTARLGYTPSRDGQQGVVSGDVGDAGAARGAEALRQVPHPGRGTEAALLVGSRNQLRHVAAERERLLRREIAGQLAQQSHELAYVGGAADALLRGEPALELHTRGGPGGRAVEEVAEAVGAERNLACRVPERLARSLSRNGVTQERHRERRHAPVVDLHPVRLSRWKTLDSPHTGAAGSWM